MIYVVDQNMMRSELLRSKVDGEPQCHFVVPDVAFEEMTKHERWEDTLRGSFAVFSSALHRTFFSAGLGELLNHEQAFRTPVGPAQLLPHDLTQGVREVVRAVLDGSERVGEVRQRFEHCRQVVPPERPDSDDLKSRMLAAVKRLAALNGPDLTSDIRSGRMAPEARLGLLKLRAERIVRDFKGFDLPAGGPFRLSQLMTTRLVYASLWYHEFWLHSGGLEAAKPKRFANDEFDMEYALLASFFDGLLSMDRNASRCAADLKLLTDFQADERLSEAAREHAVATGRLFNSAAED